MGEFCNGVDKNQRKRSERKRRKILVVCLVGMHGKLGRIIEFWVFTAFDQ